MCFWIRFANICYFCIDVHEGYLSIVIFLVVSLCGLGIKVIVALKEEFGNIPSDSIVWNNFAVLVLALV